MKIKINTARYDYLATYYSEKSGCNWHNRRTSPSKMCLDTANGYTGAIQAVTLPAPGRTIAGKDLSRDYDPHIVRVVADNLYAVQCIIRARKRHVSHRHHNIAMLLYGVPVSVLEPIATAIATIRYKRWIPTATGKTKYWDGGIMSQATRDIDKARLAIQQHYVHNEPINWRDPVIRSGISAWTLQRLSRLSGGGISNDAPIFTRKMA